MAALKQLSFSKHAEDSILERKLDRNWIERTFESQHGVILTLIAPESSADFEPFRNSAAASFA